ncbi:MAG: zf-HC2 domain-containing protein [Leptothrix sp. (in: b-proteobacteria)]
MRLLPNCREVTRLLLAGEERPLAWPDRVRIRLHLSICAACTNFNGQVKFMRQALGQWRHYSQTEIEIDPAEPNSGG